MTMKKSKRGMWEYLESIEGLLERGNEMEIKQHKALYRKNYLTNYKRKQRSERDEFNVDFLKDSMDYGLITDGAKKHNLSVPALLRSASLAYLNKTFIVPNKAQVAQIEYLLSDCLNHIQSIVKRKERFYFDREDKYVAIEKRIELVEREINNYLRQPLPVEEYVKRAVAKDPTLREQLLNLLSISLTHAYNQDINPQKQNSSTID
jgi:hypothetical protein